MKMPKKFFFCMSLKTGAWVMAGINLCVGISSFFSAVIELNDSPDAEDQLNLILTVVMGILNCIIGGVMIYALIKGSERVVLLYILLEGCNLFIKTVFSTINIFEYKSLGRSLSLTAFTIASLLLWYGLYCMVSFYNELEEYNKTNVKPGVLEITATNGIGFEPIMMSDRAIESTAV